MHGRHYSTRLNAKAALADFLQGLIAASLAGSSSKFCLPAQK
jgi:hypothetical protein